MDDRRFEPRMLCADLVEVTWKDKKGLIRRFTANLEDISRCGACLQTELPLPLNSEIEINYAKGKLIGVVRYCIFREVGFFVGLELGCRSHWSTKKYRPKHMLDPRRLVARALRHRGTTVPDVDSGREPLF